MIVDRRDFLKTMITTNLVALSNDSLSMVFDTIQAERSELRINDLQDSTNEDYSTGLNFAGVVNEFKEIKNIKALSGDCILCRQDDCLYTYSGNNWSKVIFYDDFE